MDQWPTRAKIDKGWNPVGSTNPFPGRLEEEGGNDLTLAFKHCHGEHFPNATALECC